MNEELTNYDFGFTMKHALLKSDKKRGSLS